MKKLIALLLTLSMVLSMTALAAEAEPVCVDGCDHAHEVAPAAENSCFHPWFIPEQVTVFVGGSADGCVFRDDIHEICGECGVDFIITRGNAYIVTHSPNASGMNCAVCGWRLNLSINRAG